MNEPRDQATATECSSHGYAVGDKLAFSYSQRKWEVGKITKITPSGRIVCGRFTLNPDLTIRGDKGYGGPYRGVPLTDEIKREYVRQKHIELIRSTRFEDLSDRQLDAVVRSIQSA